MHETILDILDEMAKSWHDDRPIYAYVTRRAVCDVDSRAMERNALSNLRYDIYRKQVTLDDLRTRLAAAYEWQHADPDPARVLLSRLVGIWGSMEPTKYYQMAVLFDDAKEFLEHTKTKGGKDK